MYISRRWLLPIRIILPLPDRNLFITKSLITDMDIEIIEEKDNPLMERKEMKLRIVQDAGSPKITDLRKKIAAQFSLNESLFVIQHVLAEYGMNESHCMLKIYDSEDRLRSVEAQHILRKNGFLEGSDESQ
jgi:small subunit ribosomal protein S24e